LSETLVNIYHTTRRHTSDGSNIYLLCSLCFTEYALHLKMPQLRAVRHNDVLFRDVRLPNILKHELLFRKLIKFDCSVMSRGAYVRLINVEGRTVPCLTKHYVMRAYIRVELQLS
jgi:hypothetical protein